MTSRHLLPLLGLAVLLTLPGLAAAQPRASDDACAANPESMRERAAVATWRGDYRTAKQCYTRLQTLQPDAADVPLLLARVSAWNGDTDDAVRGYRQYLRAAPDAADVWLELARAQSWRGDTAAAVETLATYRRRFGDSPAYQLTLGRVLAAGGRPGRAVALLDPLYRQDPGSFDVAHARTIAFAFGRRVGEAQRSLEAMRRLDPARPDTDAAARLVRATVGSSVDPGVGYYADSDELQIARMSPSIAVMLATATQLSAGVDRQVLRAPAGSGLGSAGGGPSAATHVWAGVGQRLGPLTLSGRGGSASIDRRDVTTYAGSVGVRAGDVFTASVERAHELFVVSPRTLDLGLTQRRHRLEIGWSPTLRAHVSGGATFQQLSDGNERWEASVTPRHAVVRRQWINVDAGVSAYRLATRDDLANGYYDPHRYESYAAVVYPYFKISDDAGVAVSVAVGPQRENRAPFRFGGSVSAEATVGIFRAWLLRASAGATHNRRLESGAFRGYTGALTVSRRF